MKKNTEDHVWIIAFLAGVLAAAVCVVLVGNSAMNGLQVSSQVGIAAATGLKTVKEENEQLRKDYEELLEKIEAEPETEVTVTDVTDVVENIMPSVVSITSRTLVNSNEYSDFFSFYFGGSGEKTEVDSGIGSGTIVKIDDDNCYILTSYHVVEGSSSFYITFNNGSAVDGVMKGSSPDDDIAVVSVPIKDIDKETMDVIRPAKMNTDPVSVGEGIIVIGNALGLGQSVVCGVVSAVDKEIPHNQSTITVIQTDAAINSGNSGGCMLNPKGEIIGISEAKINRSSVEGMCYAISIRHYHETITDLLD